VACLSSYLFQIIGWYSSVEEQVPQYVMVLNSMKIPLQNEIETLGKILGVASTVFTTLKAGVVYWTDHSLARKNKETVAEIENCLARLHKMEDVKEIAQEPGFDAYRSQVRDELQKNLQLLNSLRERAQKRETEQNEAATGIRKWLLLYRPEGIDGWIAHSLFYFCGLLGVWLLIVGVLTLRGIGGLEQWAALVAAVFAALIWLLANYLRGVSQRLKDVGWLIRKSATPHPNGDLSWWRKAVLFFKTNRGATVAQVVYYFMVVECVAFPIMSLVGEGGQHPQYSMILSEDLILVMLTEVLRADVLARRALSKMAEAAKLS
jgi:hypothetical protein